MPPSLPLATDRLLLAPLTVEDAPVFAAYRSDPGTARYQSWEAPFPLERATELLRGNPRDWPAPGEWLQLGIREDDVLVGDVAVHPLDDPVQPETVELGVTLAPGHRGRGVATEALSAVVAACFARGAHRVTASIDARNEPVARLLTRVGLRHEGRLIAAERWKGEWTDVDLWAALGSDDLPVAEPRSGV